MSTVLVSSSIRWSRMSLLNRADRPSPSLPPVAILDRVKQELSEYGANVFSPYADNAFTFSRKWFSWGRTWIGQLSGGKVYVTQSGEGVSLTVEAKLGRLLVGHLIFFSVCALVGLPLVFNIGLNLFVMLGNAAIAQWSLRGMVRRVLGGGAA